MQEIDAFTNCCIKKQECPQMNIDKCICKMTKRFSKTPRGSDF